MERFFSSLFFLPAQGWLAADPADKSLKGSAAGKFPVTSPEPYFIVSYKAAAELGLTIPEGRLSQADKIVQ
jgi:ABC-type uncharacterized transport system substrate-binding protein